MALLAEQIVEEYLYRQGYFTIRGLRQGNDEADLLGVRFVDGEVEGIHVEVSVSTSDQGFYISKLAKTYTSEHGISGRNRRGRDPELLAASVEEFVVAKFASPKKMAAKDRLAPGTHFRHVFVYGNHRDPHEIKLFEEQGVEMIHISEVLAQLVDGDDAIKTSGEGADITNLMRFLR